MSKPRTQRKTNVKVKESKPQLSQKTEKQPSWAVVRGLLTCRNLQTQQQTQQLQQQQKLSAEKQTKQQVAQRKKVKLQEQAAEESSKKCKKMRCSGSLCSNTKVMHRPEAASPDIHKKRNSSLGSSNHHHSDASSRSGKAPLRELNEVVSASSNSTSAAGGSFKVMPFRRFSGFSGCYECRMVVDPVLGFTRDPSLRSSICSCPDCGEIFMKPENLELHQSVKHAVSELGPEDTSKNIVEIIFQSSWLKKESPVCKIDRILKVHNTQKTISKFEEYRESIKAKAAKLTKKHPRCIADGNELLRFHCTSLVCSLGLNGSSNLCSSISQCNVCSIIKSGFRVVEEANGGIAGKGILTTATSGSAHDNAGVVGDSGNNNKNKRAMLVCRVIAGRVKKHMEGGMEEYDSVAGATGAYTNLDELRVFNPRAILPCFVVIYTGF